jgi:hypothetical protein
MPRKPLPVPDFKPQSAAKLRVLWRKYPDDETVRRACLEVEHQRRVVDHIEGYRVTIERAWKDEIGGQLVGLYQLRLLLSAERRRAGLGDLAAPAAPEDARKRFP